MVIGACEGHSSAARMIRLQRLPAFLATTILLAASVTSAQIRRAGQVRTQRQALQRRRCDRQPRPGSSGIGMVQGSIAAPLGCTPSASSWTASPGRPSTPRSAAAMTPPFLARSGDRPVRARRPDDSRRRRAAGLVRHRSRALCRTSHVRACGGYPRRGRQQFRHRREQRLLWRQSDGLSPSRPCSVGRRHVGVQPGRRHRHARVPARPVRPSQCRVLRPMARWPTNRPTASLPTSGSTSAPTSR